MRYFNYLTKEEEERLFYSVPTAFSNYTNKEYLAHAVGAALYCPATRSTIAQDIISRKHKGLTTMVLDLEDAIGDNEVELAEESLVIHALKLASAIANGSLHLSDLPLLFVRVRNVEQLQRMIEQLDEQVALITGFVFPKFVPENGAAYFEALAAYNRSKPPSAPTLYGMPILETASVIYQETRVQTLLHIKSILDAYKDYVLNVRIGATDFSSLFGLRRSPDMTIYDIIPIRDCMSDIINVFGRMGDAYVISGPVWEYFSNRERVLKPQLRQTPFEESLGRPGRILRMDMISHYVDGLIHEVIMDKENGIVGKTIIHPSHIIPVQALYAVTHEEYTDAATIMTNNNGLWGVMRSQYANKMNEIKPHSNWASRIMARSQIYGVLHEQQHYISLLPESEPAYV